MLRSGDCGMWASGTTLVSFEAAVVQPHFFSNEFLAEWFGYKKEEMIRQNRQPESSAIDKREGLLQEKTARQGYCAEATSPTIEGGSGLSTVGILDWPAFFGARTNTTAVSS
jgi:hypothetical protein